MGDRDERRARLAGRAHAPLRSVLGAGQGASGTDELRLPARPSSARLARDWVMNKLAADGVFGAENQVVELLTGELVANAALHGPPDGLVRVRASRTRRTVRVAVRDDGSATPIVQHSEPSAPSGRGLALVDTLAADWGIEQHGSRGKTVWFSVDLDQG